MKIVLLSDTHGYLDESILKYASKADEIWHAGDWGNTDVYDTLANLAPIRGVYGNIDDAQLRLQCPEHLVFSHFSTKIMMIHIGGYPKRYKSNALRLIQKHKPNAVVVGHSHILKVMFDKEMNHLHMNPGAAGVHGFHSVRTLITFDLTPKGFENLKVVEWAK